MVLKSNNFGAFAFYHLPTNTVYELISHDRYDRNLNIYATAWQVSPNIVHASQVEDFYKLLVCDVPRSGESLQLATGEALNKLAASIS